MIHHVFRVKRALKPYLGLISSPSCTCSLLATQMLLTALEFGKSMVCCTTGRSCIYEFYSLRPRNRDAC